MRTDEKLLSFKAAQYEWLTRINRALEANMHVRRFALKHDPVDRTAVADCDAQIELCEVMRDTVNRWCGRKVRALKGGGSGAKDQENS